MTYPEKLRHPLWQRKRLEVLDRHDFTCRGCGDREKTLHVHHQYYAAKRMPWEYPDWAYLVLCEDCHNEILPTELACWEQAMAVFSQGPDDSVDLATEIEKLAQAKKTTIHDVVVDLIYALAAERENISTLQTA